jgi:hypothetical protein
MRKIDFEIAKESGVPTALRVNGVPRYLRGALYQSFYPDGVYTASSVDVLKNDITHAKRFGFNFLRVHIKVDDPLLYYWADKLGMLIMADFPNFGEGGDTATGRRRFEAMMREAIARDFNHPSIFAWCLFNETWGFGGQSSFVDKLLVPPTAISPANQRLIQETAEKKTAPPGMGSGHVGTRQATGSHSPRRRHERLPLGSSRILFALRHRHQLVALLHQRLSQGEGAHREGGSFHVHRLQFQLRARLST